MWASSSVQGTFASERRWARRLKWSSSTCRTRPTPSGGRSLPTPPSWTQRARSSHWRVSLTLLHTACLTVPLFYIWKSRIAQLHPCNGKIGSSLCHGKCNMHNNPQYGWFIEIQIDALKKDDLVKLGTYARVSSDCRPWAARPQPVDILTSILHNNNNYQQ